MDTARGGRRAPWWLALLALALCSSWPGWAPHPLLLAAVAAGLGLLARPRRHEWWPWLGVAAAVAVAAAQPRPVAQQAILERQLGAHCEEMMAVAEAVADDTTLRRLVAATGEALKPELPFTVLRRRLAGHDGRTLYLSDDRGRLVAWAGEIAAYPMGARPIGQRMWGVAWSARSATLWVREPILIEGRLVGAVTVADVTPLAAPKVWGMTGPFGCEVVVGQGPDRSQVRANGRPGVEVPVGCRRTPPPRALDPTVVPWLMVAAPSVLLVPAVGAATVLLGGAALAVAPGVLGRTGAGRIAPAGRSGRGPGDERTPSAVGATGGHLAHRARRAALDRGPGRAPDVLAPEPPASSGVGRGVDGRAGAGRRRLVDRERPAVVTLARVLAPPELSPGWPWRSSWCVCRSACSRSRPGRAASADPPAGVVLPRGDLELDQLLPAPVAACRVDDLAPMLAEPWGLVRWGTPSELTLR